ncbi:MAG: polyhydroxyalkanoic acid system family protein [Erythrobacter sp.]|jgi:hypothetical protein
MRVPIRHALDKAEIRRRLRSRSSDIANFLPGGVAQVATSWPDEDIMVLRVGAMGQTIDGRVLVEETQVVFEVDLPAMLSFIEPMISKTIEKEGHKMLADHSGS